MRKREDHARDSHDIRQAEDNPSCWPESLRQKEVTPPHGAHLPADSPPSGPARLLGNTLVILIAPNVTEQMGGEGIKALHIFQEFKKCHPPTVQITHARNRAELSTRLGLTDVYYVEDSMLSVLIWRSVVFRRLLNWWFGRKAVRMADALARSLGTAREGAIVWQTEPNSPVVPRALSEENYNCFGPINGNIYYPPIFTAKERLSAKLRRIFHMPVQRISRLVSRGLTGADLIFAAGGERTKESLRVRGCPRSIQVDSVDCGIRDELLTREVAEHQGVNLHFIHYRAGTFHKGTFLAIQALRRTTLPVTLDIVGRGPEVERAKELTLQLGLADRVNFLGWFQDHGDLLRSLGRYRGFVLPTIEDANGIAVQEAMAMGLPPICLNWGGPQLLIEHGRTGFLVEPKSVEHIAERIAACMDSLASDAAVAQQMSIRAREKARVWCWPQVVQTWAAELGRVAGAGHNLR